jgi:hypothetical protein
VRQWATSLKVAGSISVEFNGFFNLPNPSGRTVALGFTQPLTEISTRTLPLGKRRPSSKADVTAICEPIVKDSDFFCSRAPRYNFLSSLYTQGCWCVIHFVHSL